MTSDTSAVDAQWEWILSDTEPDANEYVKRIAAYAAHEPVLRRLFPFASHSDLRFSRTTSWPYDFDVTVRPEAS